MVRSTQPVQATEPVVTSTGKFKSRDDAVERVFRDWRHMPTDATSSKAYIASHKAHEKALDFATQLTKRLDRQVFPERWEPMLSDGFKTTTSAGSWIGFNREKHTLLNTDILRIRDPAKGVRAVELYLSDTLIDIGIQMLVKQISETDQALEQSMHECNLYPARHGQALHYGRASKLIHMLRKPKPHSLRPLWDKERILIPICGDSHWYLIVVLNPGALLKPAKTISRHTRTVDDRCLVVALDPMTVGRASTFDTVDEYLRDRAYQDGQTIVSTPVHLDLLVPAQPNAYDCGIFTIFFAAIVFSRVHWFKDVVQGQLDLATAITPGTRVGFAARWNEVKMITNLRYAI
ncbi:hypothetical protein EUX98_g8570 [Antrodiella citrinella]|uniref:Ubiquitin-like protease family profile domain-containing protein n=1 Tax=Antrodiella citrinella TaxID=2447956 RepID=A0A4S4M714_9APHY|nr:hypothetical protein EUX98_g8570 [Antrodiella citrinella]